MSKRKKTIREEEPDPSEIRNKNRALLMAVIMILAVGTASAVAAYYVYSSPGGGIIDEPGNTQPPGDGGGGDDPYAPGTHMVVAEMFVTTTCPHCAAAEDELSQMEQNRSDFYFVSLVADKNRDAYNRYMNISQKQGVPDIEFDGGRKSELGDVGAPKFAEDIDYCKKVHVPAVPISINAHMNGNMVVSGSVKIAPHESFNGHVRVFVVEKRSRYFNVENKPIPNAFLGYALDENISASPAYPFDSEIQWEENHGESLQPGNIAVLAVLYDSNGMVVSATQVTV